MNNGNTITGSYPKLLQIAFFTVAVMYFGKALFIPLAFSLLIALILYPFCKWLEKYKWQRSIVKAVSIKIVILLFTVILWLLLWQMNYLKSDLPV